MPSFSRPQTLKQAKRAYRKAGTVPRLSASELAQAERRSALQERADRIKEREARRKANLKKREEKIAREREIAKRMGRPFAEDTKPGWKVGPSQLSLGEFLGGVQKPHADQEQKASKDLRPDENREDVKMTAQQEQDAVAKSVTCMSPPNRNLAAFTVQDRGGLLREERPPNLSAMRIPPPPNPQSKPILPADDTFDDCFPSNTQIERELSFSLTRPATIPPAASLQSRPLSFTQTATSYYSEVADDLLACISTQDLDFEDEPSRPASTPEITESDAVLVQICTQDLDFSDDIQSEMMMPLRADFDDGLTDDDLEDLAMELEEEEFAAERNRVQWNGSTRAACEVE